MSDGDYSPDHECCESPALTFEIPRGKGTLRNDHRIGVSLDPGHISIEGLEAIAEAVSGVGNAIYWSSSYAERAEAEPEARKWWDLCARLPEIGDQWVDDNVTYPKRLSRFAYKEYGLKVSPSLLTTVGNLARTHSEGADLRIEVTRDLNQPPSKFGHEGSCWWNDEEHQDSRCAAKTHGVFGLRSFSFRTVTGRAWVMPMREQESKYPEQRLTPTFDTLGADAFVVFNGYLDLDQHTAARVMVQLTGWSYKRINFEASPMYVNAGGMLVAPKETIGRYSGVDLDLPRHGNLYEQERTVKVS